MISRTYEKKVSPLERNQTTRQIQTKTDRVLAAIRPDDSLRSAKQLSERSLAYLQRESRLNKQKSRK